MRGADRRPTTGWRCRRTSAAGTATTLALPGNDYAGDDLVELRVGERATAIDREARVVTTSAGERIGYDALVLATGSYPFVPPIPGKRPRPLLRLPHARRPRRDPARPSAAAARGGRHRRRRRAARPGGGQRAAAAGPDTARRGARAAADARSRSTTAAARCWTGSSPNSVSRVHTGVATTAIVDTRRRARGRRCPTARQLDAALLVFSAGVRPRDELARDCGLDDRRARRGADRHRLPHTAIRTSTRSARSPRSRAAATAWSRPATRWPRWWPTGCSAAPPNSPVPTCPPSSSCSASTSPASATRTPRTRRRTGGRAQRRRQGHLRQTRRLRRCVDAARRHPGRRRHRVRAPCARWSAARCPPTRRR